MSVKAEEAAAAQEVAGAFSAPQPLFNPLFVHGNVGLGKTHLLHAIAWDVKKRKPESQVLYLTAERFMSGFVQALRARDASSIGESGKFFASRAIAAS